VSIARESIAAAGGDDGEAVPSGPLHDATQIGRVVPTAMIFAQSDPPVSHTPVEDSPRSALDVAIEAYGRTVGAVLERAEELGPPVGAGGAVVPGERGAGLGARS